MRPRAWSQPATHSGTVRAFSIIERAMSGSMRRTPVLPA